MPKLKEKLLKVLITVLLASGIAAVLILKTGIGTFKPDNSKIQKYQTARPSAWAVPIAKDGLPNLHKVSDDLYRGAQPEAIGIQQLKNMGIKTILNLRTFNSDKDKIGNTEIGYEHIYMKTWHAEDEDVIKFLNANH